MTRPAGTTRRAHARGARRGGFAFLLVLALIGIAALMIGAAVNRSTMEANLAQMQIDGYKRHHEARGMVTHVQMYASRSESNEIRELLNTGEPVRTITDAETRSTIRIYAQDGQGGILRNLPAVESETGRRFLEAALQRIPGDRLDLVRTNGPWQVSFLAAPQEVLWAISGGNDDLFEELVAAQEDGVSDSGELIRFLDRRGIETAVASAVTSNFVFVPQVWRFDVEVQTERETRHYSVWIKSRTTPPVVLEWRSLADPSQVVGFGRLGGLPEGSNLAPERRSGRLP